MLENEKQKLIILHCLKKSTWQKHIGERYYGEEYIASEGFIHCSDIHTFHLVAPNFLSYTEPLLLLCIDASKVRPEIKWEDGDNCGTAFPHIYGLLNLDAVEQVLPFLKDDSGNFLLNPELR